MEAREFVTEALSLGLPQWQSLPEDLRPVVERHCEHLVELVSSLQAAGKPNGVIRVLVAQLLDSYGGELVEALEHRA